MSKICNHCQTENEDDFLACKKCGKFFNKNEAEGIRVGNTIRIIVLLIIALILALCVLKTYNKIFFQTKELQDKKYHTNVVTFSCPKNWVPIGKIFYNPTSIPNLLTFFVASINPKEIVECQFSSTQIETDNGRDFFKNKELLKPQPKEYYTNIIKKMNPDATDIKLIKEVLPTKEELNIAKNDKNIFDGVYVGANPGSEKGKSELKNMVYLPIHYLFEYKEKGKVFNQLLEGRYVFFYQCFMKNIESNADIDIAVKYIKCENTFSYKAEKKLYKKYYGKYKNFKHNLKINENWVELANQERQQILLPMSNVTTASLNGGDKFDIDLFKTTIYNIEYADFETKELYKINYGKDLKTSIIKWWL